MSIIRNENKKKMGTAVRNYYRHYNLHFAITNFLKKVSLLMRDQWKPDDNNPWKF